MDLPDKPSLLLEKALEDLEECEKSEDYYIDMGHWHFKKSSDTGREVCNVCMAGSVLANRFEGAESCLGSPSKMHSEGDISEEDADKLMAIDILRQGNVFEGLRILDIAQFEVDIHRDLNIKNYFDVTHYALSRHQFKKDMKKLISDLRDIGL